MIRQSRCTVRGLREPRRMSSFQESASELRDTLARLESDFDECAFEFVDWLIWVWRET